MDVTYGCMIYQEQVMQIFRKLAGYSYGRADIVRRAMSKKKHKVMEQERKNFIYGLVHEDGSVECEGAVKRGVNEKLPTSSLMRCPPLHLTPSINRMPPPMLMLLIKRHG